MRRTLTLLVSALAAALVAAVVVVAVPAEGAPNGGGPGDPLLLSRVNQAGPMTVLKTNGGFRILAKNPARPPLMIYSPNSMPPLEVTSKAKVTNLNADLLDGSDVGQVRSSVAWWSNDNFPTSLAAERTVSVPPGGGIIVMIGSYDFRNTSPTFPYTTECSFALGANLLADSVRMVAVPPDSNGLCTTNAAREVSAGTYTVRFNGDLGPLVPLRGTFQAIVIPNG
jgi:hypothetical protein